MPGYTGLYPLLIFELHKGNSISNPNTGPRVLNKYPSYEQVNESRTPLVSYWHLLYVVSLSIILIMLYYLYIQY